MLQVSSSFFRFLDESDSRLAQFIHRALHYQDSCRAYKNRWATLMITDSEVNFLTLRSDGTISYLPKGKEHVLTDDGRWSRDNRQNGRPASIIRKVLTKKAASLFNDKEFESFVNSYKSKCDSEQKEFVIREAKDIPDVYCMTRERGGGTLNDSCMNGDREYLELYACCPHLRILCLMNKNGELAGRALLWSLPDGNVLCDRMYVAQDHYYDMFIEYVEKQGWIRKKRFRSYDEKDVFIKGGEEFCKSYTIETPTKFSYYPYIDTFSYGGDGWISNSCNSSYYEYNNTDGSRYGDDEDDDRYYCEYSGEYYDGEDVRYIERGRYRGGYVHMDHAVYCRSDSNYYYEECDEIVEVNGDYYRKDDDDVCYVEGDGEWCFRDDCEWSDFHEEYILTDDCVWSTHHDSFIKSNEAYNVAGEYFHESVVDKVA